jgi:hypothetical protein
VNHVIFVSVLLAYACTLHSLWGYVLGAVGLLVMYVIFEKETRRRGTAVALVGGSIALAWIVRSSRETGSLPEGSWSNLNIAIIAALAVASHLIFRPRPAEIRKR